MQTALRSAAPRILLSICLAACGSAESTSTDLPPAADPGAAAPEESPAARPAAAQASDPQAVLVTVDGTPITAGEVSARAHQQIEVQTQGAEIPSDQLALFEESLRPQVLEQLIDYLLLDRAAREAGIEVDAEEALAEVERSLETYLVSNSLTREELAERVQAVEGVTLEELLERQASDPDARRSMRHVELICARHPEETAVTDENVAEAYERDLESVYTRPEMVRASHVLIGARDAAPEAKASARAEAEQVLELARTADVAFADLAREHSTCPSAPHGGDLGFFPRHGAMVDAFAAAAFELEPGEVSDVVETQYGWHICRRLDFNQQIWMLFTDDAMPTIRLVMRRARQEERLFGARKAANVQLLL